MSYSVDVNVLLYASDQASPRHDEARRFVTERASDPDLFCLAWLTLMSYLRIATHPRIFSAPLSPAEALGNVEALLGLPRVRVLAEGEGFLDVYRDVTGDDAARGNVVPDAHLASLLRQHGVGTLYTSDRGFRRFPFLDVRDPFTAPPARAALPGSAGLARDGARGSDRESAPAARSSTRGAAARWR